MKSPMTSKAKEILKSHDIQPSIQRIKILEFLLTHRVHPSADDIFQTLSMELPTLSKTTVYNTIECFLKAGIIKPIHVNSRELRVDAFIEPHVHFTCLKCGKVYDVEMDKTSLVGKKTKEGHLIEKEELYLEGVCSECQKNGIIRKFKNV
ncbi:MAG TPA: Fur family transcriptional regulator [Candidatus Hydrothermia bacterium]|nr:Fur family transcriptional regulator [Candidatus Hydrothermia bacterium]